MKKQAGKGCSYEDTGRLFGRAETEQGCGTGHQRMSVFADIGETQKRGPDVHVGKRKGVKKRTGAGIFRHSGEQGDLQDEKKHFGTIDSGGRFCASWA